VGEEGQSEKNFVCGGVPPPRRLRDSELATGSEGPHPRPMDASAHVIRELVRSRDQFLAFVEKRVGRRDIAEDILQEAFARGIDRADTLENDASATAWFYRTLRNAVIDRHRRRGAEDRALAAFAAELESHEPPAHETAQHVCQCVSQLTATLKPEYAEALHRIEVDGVSVKAYADEHGLTANNAAVRVFRAREALRKKVHATCGACADEGCVDCTCSDPGASAEAKSRCHAK